jgi:predicted O-methyltransferase YrrM
MGDWIDSITSAWTGHREFAEWLVKTIKPKTIVELGVDQGFSTFVFATAQKNTGVGEMYGIDLFLGDIHTGFSDYHKKVLEEKNGNNLDNLTILRGDFTDISKIWTKPIDVLHIDGLHTYEAVKNDHECWSKFVKDDGIILYHDVCVPYFNVKDFFTELSGGHKAYFIHSCGLGIFTKNKELFDLILNTYHSCMDFSMYPL